MKKIFIITIAIFSICILSCKEKKEINQMEKVMAIHDEVMPELSKMGSLVGELSSKEDSTEIGLKYKQARIDLQTAHKSMMDWMQGFGNRFNSDEILNGKKLNKQKQEWLNEEEEKVNALKEQINSSINQAKDVLGK